MTTAVIQDTDQFLADFHDTWQFGATARNGVDRQAGTAEHGRIRDWFKQRAEEEGFEVRVDSIGNVFALLTFIPDADFVLTGSHLDSQPLGGRFDGCFGVIAAFHAAIELKRRVEAGEVIPQYNVAVVDWFNEEGARFAPSIMGSSVMCGFFDRDEMLAVKDLGGTTVREALESIGYLGEDEAPVPASYAEIHIEQGRLLERHAIAIGAVTQSWYTQKLNVKVLGEQSHTGATIMKDRHDALPAASLLVLKTEEVVEEFEEEQIVTSVGQFNVEPNSPIVVPREVNLVIDLRGHRREDVEKARQILVDYCEEVARARDITIEAVDFDIRDHQRYPDDGVVLTEKAAANTGVSCMRIETMAGHDSVPLNRKVPTIMIFVPSEGGVSHCEREFTADEDLVQGLIVHTDIVSRLITGDLDHLKA
ncbi:M20 family metallo-hydrolase [Corynebacterium flavescens]|uniref:M20 family metallo-hydrolase n=1 Tax=Corynebacterium flavescens TaxID=28028 RepID=UPI003FD3DCDC